MVEREDIKRDNMLVSVAKIVISLQIICQFEKFSIFVVRLPQPKNKDVQGKEDRREQ